MTRYIEQTAVPILVRWGSKEWRWTLFVWGMWLGDCPELQCLLGEPAGSCLRCLCPPNKMSNTREVFEPKTTASRVASIRNAAAGKYPSWLRSARGGDAPRPILVKDANGLRSRTAHCTDKLYEDVRKEIGCHIMEYALHRVPGWDAHKQVCVTLLVIYIGVQCYTHLYNLCISMYNYVLFYKRFNTLTSCIMMAVHVRHDASVRPWTHPPCLEILNEAAHAA